MQKYKGFLLATASGVVFAPGVQAADLPLKAAPAYVPAVSWQGWYAGIHLGAAAQSGENRVGGAGYTHDSTSFIGGGQIGYNWQRGNFVYGLEADISGLSGKNLSPGSDVGSAYITYGNHISWLATFRGRWGLAVTDTMVYATAGLAVGGVKNTHIWGGTSPNYSTSKTRVGWVVGGGVEHMWSRNWTIGLEALFVDLGRYNGSKDGITNRFSNQAVIGRFKANYRF
jgi:outer membrane immunogenic protein